MNCLDTGDAGDVYGPGGDVDKQQDACVTRPLIDLDDAGGPLSPTTLRPLPSAGSREFPDKHVHCVDLFIRRRICSKCLVGKNLEIGAWCGRKIVNQQLA